MPCRHHMFRNPETEKWGANHLLKDCRKAHKIYEALSKKLQATAPAPAPAQIQQPTTQLAIQGLAAAGAAYAQHQPHQENVRVVEEQYPLVRG